MVFLVAAATAYSFKHTPPTYRENATVALTAPDARPYTSDGATLLTTGEVVVNWIMGPQGQRQIRQAGVADGFDVELMNFANQEYPYYTEPYLTVSASAQDPAAAHRAFAIVTKIVSDHLAVLQRQQGVSPHNRISASVIADTGPLIQQGSNKRSFAGLLLLTIVVAYLAARFRPPSHPAACPTAISAAY